MSDGVMIERDSRLEFYTQPGSFGYVIGHSRRVRAYRQAFIALPIVTLVALIGFRPHHFWSSLFVIAVSFILAELLRRMVFLRGLPRTEDRLNGETWRREAVRQSSVLFTVVLSGTLAFTLIAAGLTITKSRTDALIRYGIVYSVTFTVLRLSQLRDRRRLFRSAS